MTETELKALEEAKKLLGRAWLELYNSNKEVDGTVFDIRMSINRIEVAILEALGKLPNEEDI